VIALSIVVPVRNEEGSIVPLYDGVCAALGTSPPWELILVDDGSTDSTAIIAAELSASDVRVRLIRLARNFGQTAAMQAGFDHTRGQVVVSMDGDLQNDPLDIPSLVAKLDEGYDLVAGYRTNRQDVLLTRIVPSLIANRLLRWVSGISIKDSGCSLKAYRKDLLDRMHLYADMHRFIPAIAAATAGARIAEVPVRHHPRRFGSSKYGLSRIGKVIADLLVIKMIRTFRDRPLIMFMWGALIAVLLSLAVAAPLLLCAFSLRDAGTCASETLVRPTIALLWLGLAWYLIMLGVVGQSLFHRTTSSIPLVRELRTR